MSERQNLLIINAEFEWQAFWVEKNSNVLSITRFPLAYYSSQFPFDSTLTILAQTPMATPNDATAATKPLLG